MFWLGADMSGNLYAVGFRTFGLGFVGNSNRLILYVNGFRWYGVAFVIRAFDQCIWTIISDGERLAQVLLDVVNPPPLEGVGQTIRYIGKGYF